MDDHQKLLGLPLDRALQLLEEAGEHWQVEQSRPTRTPEREGTLRVVRVQDGVLTVCAFPDGTPS